MVTEEVNGCSTLNLEQLLTDYDKWFALPALCSAPPGRYKVDLSYWKLKPIHAAD